MERCRREAIFQPTADKFPTRDLLVPLLFHVSPGMRKYERKDYVCGAGNSARFVRFPVTNTCAHQRARDAPVRLKTARQLHATNSLYLQAAVVSYGLRESLASELQRRLETNPHYRYAIGLGQLHLPVGVERDSSSTHAEAYSDHVGALWHLDFHTSKRVSVLTPDGTWRGAYASSKGHSRPLRRSHCTR